MGPGKRGLITAAVAVVCAVTVLTAPGTAFADPAPTPAPTATVTPDEDLLAVRDEL
ncbi:glycoside hydrolase, partial [Streptomyces sp. TRM76130]|nr:glycoside hydrolase [Streptomyces sp. TRM76130]